MTKYWLTVFIFCGIKEVGNCAYYFFKKNMADKDLKDDSQTAWWQPALAAFVKLSGWIGLPIIIALFLGKWLDKKYDSAPWLLLASIGLAFILSMAGLIKETISEYKKIDKLGKSGKLDKKNNLK